IAHRSDKEREANKQQGKKPIPQYPYDKSTDTRYLLGLLF
ncbi:MAG: hypothetical protein RLZZ65_1080, partial [Bacteroidota bacterium]